MLLQFTRVWLSDAAMVETRAVETCRVVADRCFSVVRKSGTHVLRMETCDGLRGPIGRRCGIGGAGACHRRASWRDCKEPLDGATLAD